MSSEGVVGSTTGKDGLSEDVPGANIEMTTHLLCPSPVSSSFLIYTIKNVLSELFQDRIFFFCDEWNLIPSTPKVKVRLK